MRAVKHPPQQKHSGLRLEMKQLRAMRGQVQIKPVRYQIAADASVSFRAELIAHNPVMLAQLRPAQRHVTLAPIRPKVHHHKFELPT